MKHQNFSIGYQTLLPEGKDAFDKLERRLGKAEEAGLGQLEINVLDMEKVNPEELRKVCTRAGVPISMFATGATAVHEGLSLTSHDDEVRTRSTERLQAMIRYSSDLSAGLIVGTLKGRPKDEEGAEGRLREALDEALPLAEELKTLILLEATNRYESSCCRSVEETARMVRSYDSNYLKVLADTFHMNIEETDSLVPLFRHKDVVERLHISDNNRKLPGFGMIDFKKVLDAADALELNSRLAIEGKTPEDEDEELAKSLYYLNAVAM